MIMRCQDKERLVAYLYDEDGAAEEREAVEAHLAVCRDCADEIAQLRGVREQLAEWQAPEIDLGFRVVREPLVAAPRSRSRVAAWAALPAAAVLALAVGAAIANVDLRYDASGVTLRTGWNREAAPAAPPLGNAAPAQAARATTQAPGMTDAAWRGALADMERRLRAEFTRTTAATGPEPVGSGAPSARQDRGDLVRQMRALIEESERRQQRELALRLAQVVQDVETQRRADLVQIEQNIGHIEGLTAAQRDMMQYLVRVSEGQ
jgi:hypothetical protein